jgi:hypothetical protein
MSKRIQALSPYWTLWSIIAQEQNKKGSKKKGMSWPTLVDNKKKMR